MRQNGRSLLAGHKSGTMSLDVDGPCEKFLAKRSRVLPFRTVAPHAMRLHFQCNIRAMLMAVAVAAVILACVVECRRIRRTQTFFRTQAAAYARLAKNENYKASFFVKDARDNEQLARRIKERIPPENRLDRHFPPSKAHRDFVESKIRLYLMFLDAQKRCLAYADETRIRAQTFAKLKKKYEDAANCLWLPFAPNPLGTNSQEYATLPRE